MDYNIIRTNLATLLGTIPTLAFVYPNKEANIEGYPAAILDLSDVTNEVLTNTENLHKGTFTIYILQEVKVIGGAEFANAILDDVSQSVINAIEDRANMDLSGAVDWTEPVLGVREEISTPQGAALSQEVKVTFWRSVSTL